jgi:hypothetical protein
MQPDFNESARFSLDPTQTDTLMPESVMIPV